MLKFDDGRYFSYEMIGEFRSSGSWIHRRRSIPSIELILVLEGEVHIAEEGESYTLLPDDILLLEPDKEHFGFKESVTPTAFYWFHFHTDMPLPFKTYRGEVYDLKKQLKRLLHITNTPGFSSYAADAAAYLVFEELCRLKTTGLSSNSALVSGIVEYVREHLRDDPTVSEISARFGYNPDYIGKVFKAAMGVGLKEYISAGRMKISKDMLLTTSKTVKQIAFEVGFSDENLFVKFFRYHEGCSPSAYRTKYCNTHRNSK